MFYKKSFTPFLHNKIYINNTLFVTFFNFFLFLNHSLRQLHTSNVRKLTAMFNNNNMINRLILKRYTRYFFFFDKRYNSLLPAKLTTFCAPIINHQYCNYNETQYLTNPHYKLLIPYINSSK